LLSASNILERFHLDIGPSPVLAGVFFCLHGVVLLIIHLVALNLTLTYALYTLILANLYYVLTLHALQLSPKAITGLTQISHGQYVLDTSSGGSLRGRLRGDSFISQPLMILNFRVENRKIPITLILLPDRVQATALRQARLRILT